jgi:hypothetical protein
MENKADAETIAAMITITVFSDTVSSVFSSILCAMCTRNFAFFATFLTALPAFLAVLFTAVAVCVTAAATGLATAFAAFATGLVSTVMLGCSVIPTPSANLTSAPTVSLPSSTVAPPPTCSYLWTN